MGGREREELWLMLHHSQGSNLDMLVVYLTQQIEIKYVGREEGEKEWAEGGSRALRVYFSCDGLRTPISNMKRADSHHPHGVTLGGRGRV